MKVLHITTLSKTSRDLIYQEIRFDFNSKTCIKRRYKNCEFTDVTHHLGCN
jgi:hypothetical protein